MLSNLNKFILKSNNIKTINKINYNYSTSSKNKNKNKNNYNNNNDSTNNIKVKSSIYFNYNKNGEQGGYMKKSLYDYDPLAKTQAIKNSTEFFAFGDTQVGDIIKSKKDKTIIFIKENDTIYDAIAEMDRHGIGALLVTSSKDGSLIGIFTERDYLGKVALLGKDSKSTMVSDAMTRNVVTVDEKTGVVEAMHLMTNKRFRHIPITNGDASSVIGLVSITDLIKTLRSNQKETIKYLNEFVNDPNSYSFKNDDKDNLIESDKKQ